jgi:hypothetical protein
MTKKDEQEKRKYPRIDRKFLVSYKTKRFLRGYELSHTRNISKKGMMLTTHKMFEPGSHLSIILRLPFGGQKIELTGEVVGSREVVKGNVYETRVKILESDEEMLKELNQFINRFLKQ